MVGHAIVHRVEVPRVEGGVGEAPSKGPREEKLPGVIAHAHHAQALVGNFKYCIWDKLYIRMHIYL